MTSLWTNNFQTFNVQNLSLTNTNLSYESYTFYSGLDLRGVQSVMKNGVYVRFENPTQLFEQ